MRLSNGMPGITRVLLGAGVHKVLLEYEGIQKSSAYIKKDVHSGTEEHYILIKVASTLSRLVEQGGVFAR